MSRTSTSQRTQLSLIAFVQVLAMSLWFSASAVMPSLREELDLDTGSATLLSTALQLGFVAGALGSAFLNLADRVRPQILMGVSALAGGGLTCVLALGNHDVTLAITLRFLTGVSLAGVYPVGMKLMTTWYSAGRGLALGVLIAALTLGSSLPQLLVTIPDQSWRSVLLSAAALAALAGAVALRFVKPGKYVAPTPPFAPRYALEMFRNKTQASINFGYLGHMWELYAFWTWLPVYIAASGVVGDNPAIDSPRVALLAFLTIGVAGVVGCILAGYLGRRLGPVRVARTALAISGCCAALSWLITFAPAYLTVVILLVWGASVIADSGQFSAALSDNTDPAYIGTALTTQTAIGFALTAVTVQGMPYFAELVGWRAAFMVLCLGPALGLLALRNTKDTVRR